jgi:hypothetical protein
VFWYPIPKEFEKHFPALYFPNEYTFIYLRTSGSTKDFPHTISYYILSPKRGLIETNWKSPEKHANYSKKENLVTAFLWKYDNEVYIIVEENKKWRIYKLNADFKKIKFNFQLIVSQKALNFLFQFI